MKKIHYFYETQKKMLYKKYNSRRLNPLDNHQQIYYIDLPSYCKVQQYSTLAVLYIHTSITEWTYIYFEVRFFRIFYSFSDSNNFSLMVFICSQYYLNFHERRIFLCIFIYFILHFETHHLHLLGSWDSNEK